MIFSIVFNILVKVQFIHTISGMKDEKLLKPYLRIESKTFKQTKLIC